MMPTTSTTSPEVAALNAWRLEKNWSFNQLVSDMQARGAIVTRSGIYRLIAEEGRQPHETTRHQIRIYLDAVRRSRAGLTRGASRSR